MAFVLVFLSMPPFIRWIRKKGSQPIRLDGPSHHLQKKGTPTMGGVVMIITVIVTSLFWSHLGNSFVLLSLFLLISFGMIGVLDDGMKIFYQNSKGMTERKKILYQSLSAGAMIIPLIVLRDGSSTIFFPFFKSTYFSIGFLFYFLWSLFIIVGSSNAVNLTDGLDGLAIGPIVISSLALIILCYVGGHGKFASYLYIPFIPGVGELSVVCSALVGASLGFLWYNSPPAMIIMGDVGALSLGAFLGGVSLMIKQEILWGLMGGIFVLEACSVMIQVLYFKKTKRRVFLMAPLHHHFEKKGWSEATVVFRFWIISALLSIIALSTLKIR